VTRKSLISLAVVLIALVAWAAPRGVEAQDAEEELRLHREPHSFTNVIDAMDGDDPFDINVSLTFNREWSTGEIQREINDPAVATGRNSANNIPVGQHEHLRNTLTAGLQIGVFHDLSIYGLLPIVLSDTRNLKQPDSDTDRDLSRRVRQETQPPTWGAPVDASGQLAIFDVPFDSQARSGIPHVNVGIAWGIFNQFRDGALPTWVVMLEGQFAIGDPMRPCQRDPVTGDDVPYENFATGERGKCNGGNDQGISDGVHWLSVETRSSYRLRYVEPYAGLQFQVGFPAQASDQFKPGGDLDGFTNSAPPLQGMLTAGLAVIPWEARARHQRLTVDLRLLGRYISEGHYFSPLFDALGTSQSAYLQSPNYETEDTSGRSVMFQGLTDIEPHGRLSTRISIEMQAAEFVRFVIGAQMGWETPYSITYSDACNPNFNADPGDPREGNCRGGIINPHHRANIDLPGRRFRIDDQFQLDLFASAVAQF